MTVIMIIMIMTIVMRIMIIVSNYDNDDNSDNDILVIKKYIESYMIRLYVYMYLRLTYCTASPRVLKRIETTVGSTNSVASVATLEHCWIPFST